MTKRKVVKISANLPVSEFELLKKLAAELGVTMTDVLRSSLMLQAEVQNQTTGFDNHPLNEASKSKAKSKASSS